jgi:CHRD domain
MNTVTTLALFLIIMIALGIMASRTSMAFARQQQKFIAKFTGYDEVPPKNTKATGSFEMELRSDGTISIYVLNVPNISNVILAHIHEGEKIQMDPLL